MRVIKGVIVLLIMLVSIAGCKKDDGISVPLRNEVNEFIWFAMEAYYYWEAEVPDLSRERYPTYNALYSFLNRFDQPESLFEHLLVEKDRFSWIVDDYEELENSFQGVSKSFGYELGLVRIATGSDDIMGYVKYVVPNGPAKNSGLERGDIFTEVNGTKLTVNNYISLLFERDSYTITLSEIRNDTISSTGEEVTLNAVELTENPIFKSQVFEIEGLKVGYLMYNQFINNNTYHEELNNVFGQFRNQSISDLVLDLRYNGGGSLTTSRILASMIYGAATVNHVLGTIVYNDNLAQFNTDLEFFDKIPVYNNDGVITSTLPMNRLSINRIFILTSGSSASASEFVIAGLMPYMDVTLIGTTTVGKNVASATLYDSEDNQKSTSLNPNHKYAIQPIISQLANSDGFSDYIDGLEPNVEVNEVDYLEDLPPIGASDEPLLAEALAIITGVARVERVNDSGREEFAGTEVMKPQNTILLDEADMPAVMREHLIRPNQ
ncbi:S41 family peptidase [Ekhidna sp.]|uniref:S41 family peptidase n=1 Tax=Ekhidna sp. TaxID=2608089 RepID=UPI0032EEE81B